MAREHSAQEVCPLVHPPKHCNMAGKPDDVIVVVGARTRPLRDIYHRMLTLSWPATLGAIAIAFLAINTLFALAYLLTGGIAGGNATFATAFYFSTQTLATIGYGALYPTNDAANVLVVVESIVSTLFSALATGVVFARFSRSNEVIVFASHPCIHTMDGVPTLALRIGNDRAGGIIDVQIRVAFVHTHTTLEGMTFYKTRDLRLARERTASLGRMWVVLHEIDEGSPFWNATPESLVEQEAELLVTVVGTDAITLLPVSGQARYLAEEIRWGHRPADVLREIPDGRLELDVRKFHDIVPTKPTDAFPYPRETR
jgi:inward rectifier potassium channel